jgi:DNA-binding PucR family transcriptional regulator
VEALLGGGVAEAREWVADVLGKLASDNDDDARLREALWAYLHSGSGYEGAARELDLGFHSVKRRVQQAVARRGRPIDDRLDVELALFVCIWYGADVLQSD